MTKKCIFTGKKPMVGNKISHANNKTKRRFLPNLQNCRLWIENKNCFIRMRLSKAALRTIDRKGSQIIFNKI